MRPYFDRDASKSCRSDLSSFSQMNPTRSFWSMSRHQAINSLAGRSHFWRAWMTTFRHSSMSSVINPSSLISTWWLPWSINSSESSIANRSCPRPIRRLRWRFTAS